MAMKGMETKGVKKILMDAYVALKIIKYSKESKFGLSGALLGLKLGENLIINNSYPLPKLSLADNEAKEDYEIAAEIERQREIGKRLMEGMQLVSEDNTTVGWYQSSLMGDYINLVTLQSQFQGQTQNPSCVCLIFDLSLASQSLKCFRAIRLSALAMTTLAAACDETGALAKLAEKDLSKAGIQLEKLFEEVPIVITRGHLLQELIAQEVKPKSLHANSNLLKITPKQHTLNHMMYLQGYISEFIQEQNKVCEAVKKSKVKKGKDGYDLDTTNIHLLSNQIIASCKDLRDFNKLAGTKDLLLTRLLEK